MNQPLQNSFTDGYDLFGQPQNPRRTNLILFFHEKTISEKWCYFFILAIPTTQLPEAFTRIWNSREQNSCFKRLEFDNLKVKGKGKRFKVCRDWIKTLISDYKDKENNFYFKVFGVNTENVHATDQAGLGNQKLLHLMLRDTIHDFFMTGASEIVVDEIIFDANVRDKNSKEMMIKLLYDANKENAGIYFKPLKVTYVDPEHLIEENNPEYSHFLQLMDIVLGSIVYCIDDSGRTNKSQKEIAKLILPVVEEIFEHAENSEAGNDIRRKYDINFVPDLANSNSNYSFHKNRTLAFKSRITKQTNLSI